MRSHLAAGACGSPVRAATLRVYAYVYALVRRTMRSHLARRRLRLAGSRRRPCGSMPTSCPCRDIAELVAAVRLRWPAQHPGRAGQLPPQLPVRAGKAAGTRRGFPRVGGVPVSRRYTPRTSYRNRPGSGPLRRAKRGARRGGGASKTHQPDRPRWGLSTTPRKLAGAAQGPGEPCGASRVFVSRKRAGCSRWSHLRLGRARVARHGKPRVLAAVCFLRLSRPGFAAAARLRRL